jgi:tripartite-type tricarboxylate transporter receptor subunit TctC
MSTTRTVRGLHKVAALVTLSTFAALVPLPPLAATALAQAYPVKPIRIVQNYTPGGPTDSVARIMAQKLSDAVGQPVTVENKPSANGVIGTQDVIRSKPDGYSLLFSTSGHTSVPRALHQDKLPFDPFKELTHITLLTMAPQMIVVNPSLGVKNIPELVKLMKANPGKYSYATPGPGGPNHLGIEMLKHMAGFDMLHVPYKGGAQAALDVVAGRVHLMLASVGTFLPQVKAGKLVAIAMTGTKRSPTVPDVPNVVEQGYPDYEVYTWYGMFGPAGLPRDITMKLNGIFNNALKMPDTLKLLDNQGTDPAGGAPEVLTRMMQSEYERWRKVIVAAKIVVE